MKNFLLCLFMALPLMTLAVSDDAALFYESGKIYVVVAILCIIFLGLALFLFRLEKKISRIEHEVRNNSKHEA